jgi:hypothetical protein
MAAYEVLLLNTAVPQIQAAQSGDTYVVPRDIAFSAALTLSAGTANGVPYLNASKVLTTGSALTFDGAILGVNGVSVGRGAGAVATNTAVGNSALALNTTGFFNTAVGYSAGYANTTGDSNTAVGYNSLAANTTGYANIAIGRNALVANTTGYRNIAIGSQDEISVYGPLRSNTTGIDNNAVGNGALQANTTGANNTSFGSLSLYSNTTASNNTAVGYQAGYSNTTATGGVAFGYQAALANTTGNYNIFIGAFAGQGAGSSITGGNNTVIGTSAGASLTTGTFNTFVGAAGQVNQGSGGLITTGSKNTILGPYNGNQGGLDIRTLDNRVVLSDGEGNPRWYIDNTGASGYGPSTGGTVTQATSRTTGVTLDKPTGAITLVSAAGTTSWQSFTVTNNTVAATDTVIVSQKSGTDLYQIFVTNVAAGSFQITFATTGGTTTEQPVFNFALIKGQTA